MPSESTMTRVWNVSPLVLSSGWVKSPYVTNCRLDGDDVFGLRLGTFLCFCLVYRDVTSLFVLSLGRARLSFLANRSTAMGSTTAMVLSFLPLGAFRPLPLYAGS